MTTDDDRYSDWLDEQPQGDRPCQCPCGHGRLGGELMPEDDDLCWDCQNGIHAGDWRSAEP